MPLTELTVPTDAAPPPDDVDAYLQEADLRIERFTHRQVHAFVPSDYALVYGALQTLAERAIAPGQAFCEWGSGMGVVASLAAMLGYDACGIEINRELVAEAELLAGDFDLPVEFVCGNLIPTGADALAEVANGQITWLSMGGRDAYDELGLDVDDFDVIFAFPWPGEEQAIENIFEHYAAVGAVLVTYHGIDGVRIQRKV